MKRIVLKNIHLTIVILLTLILLVSCDRPTRITKEFVWNEDVKELTGGISIPGFKKRLLIMSWTDIKMVPWL